MRALLTKTLPDGSKAFLPAGWWSVLESIDRSPFGREVVDRVLEHLVRAEVQEHDVPDMVDVQRLDGHFSVMLRDLGLKHVFSAWGELAPAA